MMALIKTLIWIVCVPGSVALAVLAAMLLTAIYGKWMNIARGDLAVPFYIVFIVLVLPFAYGGNWVMNYLVDAL
jgi:hypothetical protein